jgi:hypothetical protein
VAQAVGVASYQARGLELKPTAIKKKSPPPNTSSKLLMNNTVYVPEKQNLLIPGKDASLNTLHEWKLGLAFWVFPGLLRYHRSSVSTFQRLHLSFQ